MYSDTVANVRESENSELQREERPISVRRTAAWSEGHQGAQGLVHRRGRNEVRDGEMTASVLTDAPV